MRFRPTAKAAADPGLKALIEGVELTERSLLNTLEKNGVKKFDPSGEKFDPNFQQAMYEVPDPSVPAGTVVQVVQAGYMIGERVLRPALVAVSKGGAKSALPNRTKLTDLSPQSGDCGAVLRQTTRQHKASSPISPDWMRLTPALAMSAQALASEPWVSMPRQASSTT